MNVSALYIYPVKSCRGITLDSAALDLLGFDGDRRFLIVDDSGKFITQRTVPKLALIETELASGDLKLSSPGHSELAIPLAAPEGSAPPLRNVEVWNSKGLQAEDCGPEARGWLSDFLGSAVSLVRLGRDYHRPVKPEKAAPGDVVSFADAYPFLIISEASLADLNDRLAENGEDPVPMDRFRPNIVLSGCRPYEEDTFAKVKIGSAILRAAGACARCIVTTTDQKTLHRTKEPLKTLASYRRDAVNRGDVNFGQNFIHETRSGVIRLGDHATPFS